MDSGISGLSSLPVPPSPEPPPDLASLPMWQRQYLAGLSSGLSEEQARKQCHGEPSAWSLERALQESVARGGAFARAYASIAQGRALAGLPALRSKALVYADTVLDDAFAESRGLDPVTGERATRTVYAKDGSSWTEDAILPRDRLGNRRLVTDAAGVTGAGGQAQGAGVVVQASQVSMLVLQMSPEQLAALVAQGDREYQRPPA